MPSQTIQIPFAGGIDQKTAAEYVDPNARLLDVVNGVWKHDGSIEKRLGVTALAQTQRAGDPTMGGSPVRILTRGTELAVTDGDSLFSYSAGPQLWTQMGLVSPCQATRSLLFGAPGSLTGYSIAESATVRLISYRTATGSFTGGNTSGDVYVQAQDIATGASLGAPQKMTSGGTYGTPILLVNGGYAYLFYGDTTGHIYGNVLTLATMSWAGAVTIKSDGAAGASNYPVIMDAVVYSNGNGIMLAYTKHVGSSVASDVWVLRLEVLPALTISASFAVTNNAANNWATVTALAIDHNAAFGEAWVAWEQFVTVSTLQVQAGAYNTSSWTVITGFSPLNTAASTSVGLLTCRATDATHALIAWAQAGAYMAAGTGIAASQTYSPAAFAVNTAQGSLGSVVSRPFIMTCANATRVFLVFELWQELQYNTAAQSASYYLLEVTQGIATPRVVATLAPRQASIGYGVNLPASDRRACSVVVSGTQARTVIATNASEEFYAAPQTIGVNSGISPAYVVQLAQYDFSGSTAYQYAEANDEAYLSGGVPMLYDGMQPQEIGFVQWPSAITFTTSTSGGHLGSGTYGYAFTWACIDNAGLITRSVAWTMSVTTGAGTSNSVTFTVPALTYSQHTVGSRPPVLEVWRTTLTDADYHFVGSVQSPIGSTTLTFVDTSPDTGVGAVGGIATNALLYTTGGVLDAVNPPSLRCLIRHKERLWGIDDTGYVVWYTTNFNPAEAPYFNEGLTLQFADEPLTALAELDDNLVIFGATQVWLVAGDGPANTGVGSDLTSATPVPTDVGTADWRSVVAVPDGAQPGGLFFQAPSGGIYCLTRGLSVSFIGKDVQDITTGTTVVSATLCPTGNVVRFLLSTGYVLAYDYVLGRWSRMDYGAPLTSAAGMLGTTYVLGVNLSSLPAAMVLQQEKSPTSSARYYDTALGGANQWITTSITLAHLRPGGLQGWAQLGPVQGYARWLDAADILMTFSFDYGRATQGPTTFAHSVLYAANPVAAQWQLTPQAANAMAEAVQVTLSDAKPADGTDTTGQGVLWLGLAFDVVPLGPRSLNLSAAAKQ